MEELAWKISTEFLSALLATFHLSVIQITDYP